MGFLRTLLTPFSWVYGLGVAYRNMAYDRGWNPSIAFDLPVIAVGNLRVGGTGKTPHVEYLVRLLLPHYKVASLSRGYGRKTKGYLLATELSLAEDIGDEPRQLKQKFPDLEVAVGENRAAAVPAILADEPEVQVILMDDAFQHRAVEAGLKILLTTYNDLYTDDRLLPAGRLREGASGAKRADMVLVTKCPLDLSGTRRSEIVAQLGLSRDVVYFSGIRHLPVRELFETKASASSTVDNSLNKEPLIVLSGIAAPEHFENAVGKLFPTSTQTTVRFRDHHDYRARDLDYLLHKASKTGSKTVLTTEKDAMRLMALREEIEARALAIHYIPMEVVLLEREEVFHERILSFVAGKI